MYIIQAFGIQVAHTLLALLGFFFMGWSVLPWIKAFSKMAQLSITVGSGYAFSLTATYIGSSITEHVSKLLLPIFVVLFIFGFVTNLLMNNGFGKTTKNLLRNVKTFRVRKVCLYLFFPIFAALAPVLIPLWKFTRDGHFNPTFTQGNNDIAQFILAAEAISRGGFHGIGFIANQDQFAFARDNDFGAPNFLLWISRFTFSEPWIAVTPSISLIAILLTISISEAVHIRSNLSLIQSYFIGLIASSSAVPLYLYANIFSSQLISMWIWANILLIMSKVFSGTNRVQSRNLFAIVGLHFAAGFYTYPHMTIICLGVYGLSLLFYKQNNKISRQKRKINVDTFSIVQSITIPIIICTLFCNIYLIKGINLFLFRASSSNGWPMPNQISFANIFFVGDYSGSMQSIFVLASLLVVIGLVLHEVNAVTARSTLAANRTEVLAWTLIPIGLYFVLAFLYGPASYKAWKVLFSFAPTLIAGMILSIIFSLKKSSVKAFWNLSPLLSVFVLAPMLLQSLPLIQNENLYKNRVSSQDLYNLRSDLQKFRLKDLNIQLSPFFETMYAGAIIKSPVVHFSVPTYSPIMLNEDTCTLIRTEDLSILELDYQEITRVNDTYSLIDYPASCLSE
jgi:hypothetical protein